ncbi:MAG TPA: hypothetical protein VF458_19330 [Ktedonobacteraceae bacterium]
MGFNPFRGRKPGGATNPPNNNPPQNNPSPPGANGTASQGSSHGAPGKIDNSELNLVNYTPEQLVQQVNDSLASVELGMPWPIWFKWQLGEVWSVLGPICLFMGTSGEVFFFIWNNTTDQGTWWVALSVLITVCVLEFTFMVVSYQSDTIRNHIKNKPGGATDEDKRDMRNHRIFWFILAAGVAIGQISFLVVAMQTKLTNLPFLIGFSVGRSAFTLAGDFYSAFIHKEKPSTGEQLKAKNKQRADLAADLLNQKQHEVTIINDGILGLREKHTDAVIRDEAKQTELEMKRLENKSRVEALGALTTQARMFTELSSGMVRALIDPKMDEDERQQLLGALQGFMSATKHLKPPANGRIDRIEEEGL